MLIFTTLLLCVTAATAEDASNGSQHINSLYDSRIHQFENNTLSYKEFNESYTQHSPSYYQFTDFKAGFNHYSYFPTLVVFQRDESVKELHGYYLPNGLLSLLSYREGDPLNYERYRPLREYFLNSSTEAVTPYSAKYAYPHFYKYHLVNFVAVGDVAPKFAVFFVAPTPLRKPHIDDYNEVVRYYNDPTTTIIRDVY